ncbi:MAG: hypothetical protein RIQ79_2591, partial [Verrucomicrobiota bacterium]
MLKKLFSKLRATLAPSPAKSKSAAPSPAHKPVGKPQAKPAAPHTPRAHNTTHGGQKPYAHGGAQPNTPRPPRGHHTDRPPGGGRQDAGRAGRGPKTERPERPKIDQSFDGPTRAPIKPREAVVIPPQDTAFSKLGLSDAIAFAVAEMGYTEPTPIQAQAVPVVLAGKDVIGSAQTGTGKTAAFALPLMHRLGSHQRQTRVLVLEPTRELALQVEEAFQKYAKYTDLSVTVVYGGVGYGKQRDDLARGVDVIAATPGRLLDHLEQGTASLANVEILVLDEVDRMLDMGFLPDVKRIIQKCPQARQTLFFSATMPPELAQ